MPGNRHTTRNRQGGIMNPMISFFRIAIAVLILLVGYRAAPAQQNEKRITNGTISRLSGDSEFAFSETYTVINPKRISIDADIGKSSATLRFSTHPVYTFALETIDYESEAVSISGRYLQLTGNGTAHFYIDRAAKKIFLKQRGPDGYVRKIFYGAVRIEKLSTKKERILFERSSGLTFTLHNPQGIARADFSVNDFFMFSLNAKPLQVNNIINPDVWNLTGNTDDVLSLNTSRKILYYKNKEPKVTWAGVE